MSPDFNRMKNKIYKEQWNYLHINNFSFFTKIQKMIYISAKKKSNEKKNEMSVKINVQTHKFKTIIVKMRCFHSTASHFYHALEFSSDGQYYRYKFSLQIQISSFPREIINLRA